MLASIAAIFDQFRSIFGICPCCDAVFRLSDVYLYTKGRKPSSIFDELAATDKRLVRAEERLADQEDGLRAAARAKGLKVAKRILRKIDPVFSGQHLDPQDVKVIFDPIEYVVFDGMNRDRPRRVLLMDRAPQDARHERLQDSIITAISRGNYEWKTVRISTDGRLEDK